MRRSRPPCRLARAGNVIAMFPEGTRRRKGLRKTVAGAAHTGAARIALEAGVPLVPAGIKGTDGLRRLQAGGCATGSRSTSRDLGEHVAEARSDRDRPAMDAIEALEERCERRAARRRRRLARPSRLPRDPEVDSGNGRPAMRSSDSQGSCCGSGKRAAGSGGRRLGFARDAHLPARGAARLPVGPRVRACDPRAARPAARTHGVVRLHRRRRRPDSRPTTSWPPLPQRGPAR